jgi:hypothetical protein
MRIAYIKYFAEFKPFHSLDKFNRKNFHREENARFQDGFRRMYVLLRVNSLQLLSSSYQTITVPCFNLLSIQDTQW